MTSQTHNHNLSKEDKVISGPSSLIKDSTDNSDSHQDSKNQLQKSNNNNDPILDQTRGHIEKLMKRVHIPVRLDSNKRKHRDYSPPPDVVRNVQGSSAGAGSGEFHVYRQLRRKEMTRIHMIEEEIEKEKEKQEFIEKQQELNRIAEEKTAKKREKRKKRNKKQNIKNTINKNNGDDDKKDEQTCEDHDYHEESQSE